MKNIYKNGLLLTLPLALCAQTLYVQEDANIRVTPSLTSDIAGVYKKDEKVDVIKKVFSENGTWYETSKGYVSVDLLQKDKQQRTDTIRLKMDVNKDFKESILSADDEQYTITLIYARASIVEEFIEKNLKDNTNYFILERDGYYKVIYGLYEDKLDGRLAFKNLDDAFKKNGYTTKIETLRNAHNLKYKPLSIEQQTDSKGIVSKSTNQEGLYIDVTNDTVYTRIPKELQPKLLVEKSQKIQEQQAQEETDKIEEIQVEEKIHGNFSYAKNFENEKFPQTKQPQDVKEQVSYLRNMFVSMQVSTNKFDGSKKDISGSILIDNPKTNGMGYKLSIGKYIYERYALAFNYNNVDLDQINIYSYSFSLDYRFKNEYHPYMGVTFGKIYKKWNKDPLVNSTIKDNEISSYLYGAQGGAIYPLKNNWFIDGTLSYQKFDLKTNLISTPAKSIVEYKDRKALELGIRYEF